MTNKIVLISGATSGIGEACAIEFAKKKYNLVITGRREKRLEALKQNLEENHGILVHTLTFDIRKQKEVAKAIASIPRNFKDIDVLVNNAGLAAGVNPIDKGVLEDWEVMIDTNVKGLLYLSKEIIAIMKVKKAGHIINIGSIAGKMAYPNGNVYCGTKSAVQAITEGMRIDLLPYQIKVTQVAPGAVETEFSLVRLKGDSEAAKNVYNGYKPLTAKDIADVVIFTTTLPPHANINDVLVMPTAQANAYQYNKSSVKSSIL
ncbi:MAG: SDR family NAD(P)-dependent oxidoreductase [Bacteroidales bacterium]|nr:SDR family NAD(P)-dependent oxidoreductase [Bacteroidales bacterium]